MSTRRRDRNRRSSGRSAQARPAGASRPPEHGAGRITAPPPADPGQLPGDDDYVGRILDLGEGEEVVAGGVERAALDAPVALDPDWSDGDPEGEGGDWDDEELDGHAEWDEEWSDEGPAGSAEGGAVVAAPAAPRARRPLVAIVGRPNVGKSRLFNRMTGTRFAIVEDEPGVTRDRQYGEGTWDGRAFQVVDTGGFEPESDDALLTQMKEQARIAMDEADIILFVMDGRAGLLPADREIAEMLRRADRLMVPVVNKIDGDRHEGLVGDFYALGFPELVTLSAEHGRNYDELMDRIVPYLPRLVDVERTEEDDIAVAVIGRPNAGKSTLINRLLGEERLLTSDIPGTTRDAVNTRIEVDGQSFLFIDTAGIRRKRSIHETVEKYSVVQAFKAIDRADVVLHMLDASAQEGVSTQDKRIAGMAHEKGRAALLLLNKWDAVEKDHRTADERIRDVRDQLRFNRYAPAVTISAKTGQRVYRILPLVRQIHAEYTRRVSTAALNRVLREALNRNPPPSKGRRRLKIYYASQVASGPPTLMLVINKKELMHFSYERYLRNCIREAFAFEGAPIKIFLRERAQRRDAPALIDDD